MLDRKRPVVMVTVLSILLAMTFGLSSAGALPQPVAEIDTTLRYQGEPEIPGGETTPIIQVYTAINAIDMLDASNAWAVGSIQNDYPATAAKRPFIARTTDGGSTITTAEVAPNGVLKRRERCGLGQRVGSRDRRDDPQVGRRFLDGTGPTRRLHE